MSRQARRVGAFYAVGALGFGVQIATLATLKGLLGLDYLVATGLAVEVSVLHNFLWHERWTWADRTGADARKVLDRLVRFHVATAIVSIVGNLVFTWLLVTTLDMHYLVANLLAVASTSVLNFLVSDRLVFRQMKEEGRRVIGATAKPARAAAARPAKAAAAPAPKIDIATRVRAANTPVPLLARTSGEVFGGNNHRRRIATMKARSSRKLQAMTMLIVFGLSVLGGGYAEAAELKSKTVRAWDRYVELTERRIAAELQSGDGFLVIDFQPGRQADIDRRRLLAGEVLVEKMETQDENGDEIEVPSGMIHHWRGAVFVPGVTVAQVLSRVENPDQSDTKQDDVLASEVLARSPGYLKIYLQLQRKKIVTVTLNTEHEMRFTHYDEGRASSSSATTRIAEVMDVGTPREREKPEGNDSGFLWRLNSYWRYEQVDGGVIVELESLSLSRSVPILLWPMAAPLIKSAAKGSVDRTLTSMRERFVRMAGRGIQITAPAVSEAVSETGRS